MMLFYTDVPVLWWQMYKLGLYGSKLLVYALIFDCTVNRPYDSALTITDISAKLNQPENYTLWILDSLIIRGLIYQFDGCYYAMPLDEKLRRAITRAGGSK